MPIRFNYNALLFVFILFGNALASLNRGDKCALQDGTEGVCEVMKECATALQLVNTGIVPVTCGLEDTKSIVCCKKETNITTTTSSSVTSRIPGDISKQKCEEYAEYAYEKIPAPTLLLNPHYTKILVCDIPRNRLVVGSSLAARREFPHMTLVGYFNHSDHQKVWACGGSLISENYVLTTAHCLFSRELGAPKFVRIGLTNKSDSEHMQERTVIETIPYPKYDNLYKYHDIGLLRLSKNVAFNTYVRPACLQTEKFIPYVSAVASGWGARSYSTDLSNDLLATVLEFYDEKTCNRTYPSNPRLKNGILDDLMFCAGISKSLRATCQGDGGGPLQVYHQETEDVKCMYDVIGVISFGKPCGVVKNVPDVFTRVSAYIKWIESIVWPN